MIARALHGPAALLFPNLNLLHNVAPEAGCFDLGRQRIHLLPS